MAKNLSKEERKAIKRKLRDAEMQQYEKSRIMHDAYVTRLYSDIKIENAIIGSPYQLDALLSKLRALQLKREVKLISGSFDNNTIVETEFIMVSNCERWHLSCLCDGPYGKGFLKKL